jgi:acetyl esterase
MEITTSNTPQAEPLDPQIKLLVDNLPGGIALPVGVDPVKMRDQFRRITVALRDQLGPAELEAIEEITVPGATGELAARVYRPKGDSSTATILFFHGGGFIVGDIETHDLQVRALAERTGATIVSSEYRLAPEDPFPAAADDAEVTARWVVANVDRFGGDASRMVVAGDSAGGNLAAVCAQRVPGVTGQLLIYPATDFSSVTQAMIDHAEGPLLTAEAGAYFRDAYLGDADPEDPRVSPLRGENFGEQPPAVVVTCEYDLLRDDGARYAEKLAEHSVAVTHLHYPSLMHGFLGFYPLSEGCDKALDEIGSVAVEQLLS